MSTQDERIAGFDSAPIRPQGSEVPLHQTAEAEALQQVDPERIEAQASEAMSEEFFDFVSATEGVDYPRDTVSVTFAPAEQLQLGKLRRIPEADRDADYEQAVAQLEQKIKERTYVFHLVALPRTRSEEIVEEAQAIIPIKHKRIKLPNNQFQLDEIPSPDRDRLINELTWAEQIEKIVDYRGLEQIAPGRPAARRMFNAPRASFTRFRAKLIELEYASSVFEGSTDATFLGGGADLE